jgi:putative chitinase
MLKIKSTGLKVKALQTLLQVPTTGVFAGITDIAVRDFQRKHGLVVDGLVGKTTFKALILNPLDAIEETVKCLPYTLDTTNLQSGVRSMFSSKAEAKLRIGLSTITANGEVLQLDTLVKLCHFIGQVKEEVGYNFNDVENMNYSVEGLKNTFRYYRDNPSQAWLHGRTVGHKAKQETIANHAYANKYGNGSHTSGDGWKYRGEGAIQVTFKDNNIALNSFIINNNLDGVIPNFIDLPHSKSSVSQSLVSGAVFWAMSNIGDNIVARNIVTKEDSRNCTKVINRYTNSYEKRWNHTKKLAKLLGITYAE